MILTSAKVQDPAWRAIISRRWCSASVILNQMYEIIEEGMQEQPSKLPGSSKSGRRDESEDGKKGPELHREIIRKGWKNGDDIRTVWHI
jgi:hypothetical protein